MISGANSSGTSRLEEGALTLRATWQQEAFSSKNIYSTYTYYKGLLSEFNTGISLSKLNNKRLYNQRMAKVHLKLPKIGCFKEQLMKCHEPFRRKRDKN